MDVRGALVAVGLAAVPVSARALDCDDVEEMFVYGIPRSIVAGTIDASGGMTEELAACFDAAYGDQPTEPGDWPLNPGVQLAYDKARAARREGRIGVVGGAVGLGVGVGVLTVGRSAPVRTLTGGVLLVGSATGIVVGWKRLSDAKWWEESGAISLDLMAAPRSVGLAWTF